MSHYVISCYVMKAITSRNVIAYVSGGDLAITSRNVISYVSGVDLAITSLNVIREWR